MRGFLWFLLICLMGAPQAVAQTLCLFSLSPEFTIREEMDSAEAVVLGEWVSSQRLPIRSDDDPGGRTTFRVVEVLKDSKKAFTKTTEFLVDGYHEGKSGDLALLMGDEIPNLSWQTSNPVTKAGFNYIKALPKQNAPWEQRLEFFLKYLENADELVAGDAYLEFEKAPFEEIKKISEKLPREKLRQWVRSKKTSEDRLALYGEMLGLCGDEQDVLYMENLIKKNPVKPNDFRLGMAGIMGGYLLLKGEGGLKLLEETKLKPGVKTPFSETYFAMQAVRFAWDYGDNIKKDRLKQSMRLLLDRPEIADLAIHDLTRWKDWAIQDKILELYGRGEFDQPATKRAIVKYLLTCGKDTAENADGNPIQEHAMTAKKHLGTLREKDPQLVKQVERYFRGVPLSSF